MPRKSADDRKRCVQCRFDKPLSAFFPERKGAKIRFCWECASRNMRKWARTKNVGMKPEQITEVKD